MDIKLSTEESSRTEIAVLRRCTTGVVCHVLSCPRLSMARDGRAHYPPLCLHGRERSLERQR